MIPAAFVETSVRLAPAASLLVSAAPIPTIRKMQANQSVGNNPLLPYSAMAANCCLWSVYGVLQHQSAVVVPNLLGLIMSLYYFRSFVKLSPEKSPTLPGSVRQHQTAVLAVMVAAVSTAAMHLFPAKVYGKLAVLCCILLFASPLASLKTVIQQKSAESIPMSFTIASVTNCALWTVAGLFKFHDINLIIPNVLGLMFGLSQVGLKLLYGDGDSYRRYRYAPAP